MADRERNITPSIRLNTVVFAAMPSVSDIRATAVNAGLQRIWRNAKPLSASAVSNQV
jgi:hypothetical protein